MSDAVKMPLLIAHRGNTRGPSDMENHPDLVQQAMDMDFDVEVDLHVIPAFDRNELHGFLGHDHPRYQVHGGFLANGRLWVHAKNAAALEVLHSMDASCTPVVNPEYCRFFWHDLDDYAVVTGSPTVLWMYPGRTVLSVPTVYVMPETIIPFRAGDERKWVSEVRRLTEGAYGICSDYVEVIRDHWGVEENRENVTA